MGFIPSNHYSVNRLNDTRNIFPDEKGRKSDVEEDQFGHVLAYRIRDFTNFCVIERYIQDCSRQHHQILVKIVQVKHLINGQSYIGFTSSIGPQVEADD